MQSPITLEPAIPAVVVFAAGGASLGAPAKARR